MAKAWSVFFLRLRQCDPGLNAEQARIGAAPVGCGAFRMYDTAASDHPVDFTRPYCLRRPETVAVNDLASEQIGHGRQANVRMRPYIKPGAGAQHGGTHLVEEDKWTHHSPLAAGQRAAYVKAVAEVVCRRHDDGVDAWICIHRRILLRARSFDK